VYQVSVTTPEATGRLSLAPKMGRHRWGKQKTKTRQMRKKEQNIADKRQKMNEDQVGIKKLSTYKTLSEILQRSPKDEIPKIDLSLLSKPFVFYKTICRQ
jgi:hypothetical protein